MPAYNAGRFIGMALSSVQAQTFRDHEIIVIDDGSTDNTSERAAEVAPEALLLRQANGGPGRARNAGIARARGRLVAFLDADDVWFPDALATLVNFARRHPDAGLVHAEYEPSYLTGPPPLEATLPRLRFCEIFHQLHPVPTGAVLVPRKVLEEVGGFDERREVYVEDWELWLRIAARHPVGYVARSVLWHRPGGIMSSAAEKTYRGQQITIGKTLPLCQEVCPRYRDDPENCVRRRLHLTHHIHGRELLRAGRHRAARDALRAALDQRPLALRTRLMHAASFLSERILARFYDVCDLVRCLW
jgi:glycosyltransferase involved in cell wall biosynthesis